MSTRPNVVLVHGAWADGSRWSGVIERLQADGYHVTAPQFPETSLADDVARLRQVLELQDGPTIVAGHSYGGQIETALGTDAPNAAGLVYIAAFGLDEGESLGALLSQGPTPTAGDGTVQRRPSRLVRAFAPVTLKVYFLRPVPPDGRDLVARGTVIHRGRSIAIGTSEVFNADGKKVASRQDQP